MVEKQMVAVKQLPVKFSGRQRSEFFREMKGCLDRDRPYLVLDCSRLAHMDRPVILLLLCCLEEAMKRNGDVRLVGVSPQARAALQAAEADILFGFYDTNVDAVASFRRRAGGFTLRDNQQAGPMRDPQSIA
jgi:anti-anti-sigma regulatory factor